MSFQQGLSGLNAAAKNLDVIGNNVANTNTVGYKGAEAQFSDVFASSLSGASGINVGIGTSLSRVQQQFVQGNIAVSSNPLDMAINGGGFFRMTDNGVITFTRNGQFNLDKNGYIVNASGERLTGYGANANGVVNTSAPTTMQISASDISPAATTTVTGLVNLDSRDSAMASAGFNIGNSATYHNATSLSAYDTLGNAHSISMYFLKTASNIWDVFAAVDGVQIGAAQIGTIEFDGGTGAISTAVGSATTFPVTISAPVATGATTPMPIKIDLSGTTQFGSAFGVNSLTQDGSASGRLAGYNIGADGTILGRYSNGQSKTLGQVVLANFTNPGALQSLGRNSWGETLDSGVALVGVPGTSSLGVVQSGALEESNIDLTAELVKMITAQRVYQSNAQTIKTQDSVLQTLVNLR